MSGNIMKIMDGNEAAASVAYRTTELSAIYPITPSSTMGEFADEWSAKKLKNIWGFIPQVSEMQSEAGAAGALHGALQTGALATTYTASQGLLLMIPNMYKIAGELTSCVIHVAARALAAQALSIFGDHSDVMAARSTGFAMLASASPQIAHDFAAIAHAATLAARVPFVHFFDGFRTSHEIQKIEYISDDTLRAMIDDDLVKAHRERALNPDHAFIRGTAQNPDVYFQSRETVNNFYPACVKIVKEYMERFARLTGRKYETVSYYGAADAEKVIIIMGSAAITTRATVEAMLKQGEKVGVVHVQLYRPFPTEDFLAAIPKTVKAIAVLDRTKEPGAIGEPLFQDVLSAISVAVIDKKINLDNGLPKIIGGRYGIGSKEFTPGMVKGVFDELKKENPKQSFTVGIEDDVSHSSIDYDKDFSILSDNVVQALFYGLGADGTVGANKNSIKIIGENTDLYAQGYFVYDSKKSGSQTVSHLRFGPELIPAPYLIEKANFIGCHHFPFVIKYNVLEHAAENATFLLNSPYSAEDVWSRLPGPIQQTIIDKKIKFYVIDASKVAAETGMGSRTNTIMQTCFFAISNVLPKDEAIAQIKKSIQKTYSKKGEEVVQKNFAAVDATLANLKQVQVPNTASTACQFPRVVSEKAPEFVQNVIAEIMANKGDDLPVSAFPIDGTYPSGTTKWEKRNVSMTVADWHSDLCIQCGQCGLVCPHGVIRSKHCSDELLQKAPAGFKSAKIKDKKLGENENFALQVYVEDCTGCSLCHVVCPGVNKANPQEKAMMMADKDPILEKTRQSIDFFETLPYSDRTSLDTSAVRHLQYLEPMFEFSGACAGCGETPYIKAISQLFGDRMVVANATGCTSIYGGNLPTTPWTHNQEGQGPAWANSLFEDNAEFGFGMRLREDFAISQAVELLHQLREIVGSDLVESLKAGLATNDEKSLSAQRMLVKELQLKLQNHKDDQRAINLMSLAQHLVKRSVWIMGGDGWAYDIGYGGLDHVMASGRNVNVLVVDTEVYSNTGGQASKSTPLGAIAKFAASGKTLARKNLGIITMMHGHAYVAQIALGANQAQALKAIKEAEAYNGPSLIIAYSHCIAHGYDLSKGLQQQKLAVASGSWPLYRYNPNLRDSGQNPLQIDSAEPSIPFKDYAYNETRFKALQKQSPELAEKLLIAAQKDVEEKWKLLKKLAG